MSASAARAEGSGRSLQRTDELWRRRHWRDRPAAHPLWGGLEIAGALTLAYSWIVNRVIPDSWYIPGNAAAAAAFIALGRGTGATWTDMGLRPDRAGRGLRVGLAAAAPIAAVVALGVAVPASRRYFADQRVIGLGAGTVVYDALVRIPLGTAVCEEVIFRGAMLGMLLRRRTPLSAVVVSSLLFGLWHVFPTLDTLHLNPAGALVEGSALRTTGAVIGTVAATSAAGVGFAWLRLRANSVVAPIVAHAALNVTALLAGRLVVTVIS